MSTQIYTPTQAWTTIDKEYPGITKINHKFKNISQSLLSKLACYIKINLPKSFYSPEIADFDNLLQDLYYDLSPRSGSQESMEELQEIEISRTNRIKSDESEAQQKLEQRIPAQKYSILQVKDFIANFNNMRSVSTTLIGTVSDFAQSRKQKAVYQNPQWKQKQKNKSNIIRLNSKQSKEDIKKKDIVITLGDKIPLEVIEMKNYVKRASLNSYAVSSEKMEREKSEIELDKTMISFGLNKLARQNLVDIFQQIRPLAVKSEQISQFLASQILQKCMDQPKMAEVYLQFACTFTKISKAQFTWNWRYEKQQPTKLNSFHRVLTQIIQQNFHAVLAKQDTRNLKHITFVIGYLIRHRKLSRRIFPSVFNSLLENITCQKYEVKKELSFEAVISLIDSLRQVYDENWGQLDLQQILSTTNYDNLCDGQQQNIETLLTKLIDKCNFNTSRIKCLTQNLFSKKQSLSDIPHQSNNPEQHKDETQTQTLSELKIKQIMKEDDGLNNLISILKQNDSIFCSFFMALFDGHKNQVIANVNKFVELSAVTGKQFGQLWRRDYLMFVDRDCDLPYMVDGLALIIGKLGGIQQSDWKITVDEDETNEDFEDIMHFMNKLSRKIGI